MKLAIALLLAQRVQTQTLVEKCEHQDVLPSPNKENRYRPKGVFGKGVGNSENVSEMRQTCAKMGLVLLGKEERPKCVRNPSKAFWLKKCAQANLGCNPPLGWARGFRLDPADPS